MKSAVRLRHTPAMTSTSTLSAHDRILAERVALRERRRLDASSSSSPTPTAPASPTSTAARFIDFAGGIGCQNTGHRFAPVVDAIKAQADEYLHQCFMVGVYEPYVEVCRRLAELSPCAGTRTEVAAAQLGSGGGRERGQDRALGDGPAGSRRLRQRLPRPDAADDDDDRQGEAVQGGVRPVRTRGVPGACAEPLSRRHARTTRSRG